MPGSYGPATSTGWIVTDRRVGIVGCGGMGRTHARAIETAAGMTLVAACDRDEAALSTFQAEVGPLDGYADHADMYATADLDVVVVATHARAHADPVVDAAAHGVAGVLVEKPIALDLGEADRMVESCRTAGTALAVNMQQQVDPNVVHARALIENGAIGRVKHVTVLDKGGRPAGNSLMEMAIHLFNLTRYVVGEPEWVTAQLTVEDRPATRTDVMPSRELNPGDRDCGLVLGERATATFGLAGGVTASFASLAEAEPDSERCGLDVLGTDGRITIRGSLPPKVYYADHEPWLPEDPMVTLDVAETGRENLLVAMHERLVRAIERDQSHPVSGEAGRTALEFVMGIYESYRRDGTRVELPLQDRTHPLAAWVED